MQEKFDLFPIIALLILAIFIAICLQVFGFENTVLSVLITILLRVYFPEGFFFKRHEKVRTEKKDDYKPR